MTHSRAAAALVVSSLLALGACSSSNNGSGGSGTGGSGGSSGSSGGSGDGRSTVTCAQAATAINNGTIVSTTSWSNIPTALQFNPPDARYCGIDELGDGGTANGGPYAVLLSSLTGTALLNAYQSAATSAGCTLTQQTTGLTCTFANGGIATIVPSETDDFIFLSYFASF